MNCDVWNAGFPPIPVRIGTVCFPITAATWIYFTESVSNKLIWLMSPIIRKISWFTPSPGTRSISSVWWTNTRKFFSVCPGAPCFSKKAFIKSISTWTNWQKRRFPNAPVWPRGGSLRRSSLPAISIVFQN